MGGEHSIRGSRKDINSLAKTRNDYERDEDGGGYCVRIGSNLTLSLVILSIDFPHVSSITTSSFNFSSYHYCTCGHFKDRRSKHALAGQQTGFGSLVRHKVGCVGTLWGDEQAGEIK